MQQTGRAIEAWHPKRVWDLECPGLKPTLSAERFLQEDPETDAVAPTSTRPCPAQSDLVSVPVAHVTASILQTYIHKHKRQYINSKTVVGSQYSG